MADFSMAGFFLVAGMSSRAIGSGAAADSTSMDSGMTSRPFSFTYSEACATPVTEMTESRVIVSSVATSSGCDSFSTVTWTLPVMSLRTMNAMLRLLRKFSTKPQRVMVFSRLSRTSLM